MPELMENILNNLKNDPNSLYSCALDLPDLEFIARKWISFKLVEPIPIIYFDALVNVVINLLLKLIFESGAVLHELILSFPDSFEFKPEIFYSIGRNELLFSILQHLSLSVIPEFNIENVTIFLKVLAKNITTISSLKLEIYSEIGPRLFHSLFHAIIRIIKSQEQLKQFNLVGKDHHLTELHAII
ncbi:hypothetical protein F8M41_025697 [Gigaspora margarita]|uniref:Uncharacterized protein n=1 Tax=Gigaspora margarita TaxID=4874 RepID=A0A8H4B018_GIGMA|nr:hypothetical protein F8M41_025697 [Gigaspora margarita]